MAMKYLANNILDFGVRSNAGRIKSLAKSNSTELRSLVLLVLQGDKSKGLELIKFLREMPDDTKQVA
jgi:hypothetical protein